MLPMSLHTYLYHCLSLSSMYRPHGSLMSHDFFCWQAVTETHPHPSASPAVGRLSAFQPSSIFRHASLPGMCPRSAMMVEAARGHTSPLRSLSTQSWSQRGRLQEITGGTKSFSQAVRRALAPSAGKATSASAAPDSRITTPVLPSKHPRALFRDCDCDCRGQERQRPPLLTCLCGIFGEL